MTQEQKIELENLELEYHRKHLELLETELKMTPFRILKVKDSMARLNSNQN